MDKFMDKIREHDDYNNKYEELILKALKEDCTWQWWKGDEHVKNKRLDIDTSDWKISRIFNRAGLIVIENSEDLIRSLKFF